LHQPGLGLDGKSLDEVRQFSTREMLELFGPRLTPNRQKCCLLPWRVAQTAIVAPLDEEGGAADTFAGPDLGEES